MSGRRRHAALVLAHCVPPALGVLWFQLVGVAELPRGPWPWLAAVFVLAPLSAACAALWPRWGARTAMLYGLGLAALAIALLGAIESARPSTGSARTLAAGGLVSGIAIATLAGAVRLAEIEGLS